MPAPVSPDAERLMELAQAWVDAETRYENCTFTGTEGELIEEGRKCSAAEAAFREALFAQPDAGAMAEARELAHDVLRQHFGPFNVDGHLCDLLESAIAIYAARREAAGFARGVEAVCKIAEDYICPAPFTHSQRVLSDAAKDIASAGRALLGEGKEGTKQ
jgi:hypothetical protein